MSSNIAIVLATNYTGPCARCAPSSPPPLPNPNTKHLIAGPPHATSLIRACRTYTACAYEHWILMHLTLWKAVTATPRRRLPRWCGWCKAHLQVDGSSWQRRRRRHNSLGMCTMHACTPRIRCTYSGSQAGMPSLTTPRLRRTTQGSGPPTVTTRLARVTRAASSTTCMAASSC